MRILVEACVDSTAAAAIAMDAGADRVELCANLVEGGTTPSAGSIGAAVDLLGADVMVMIRPRGGDFVYDAGELDVMRRDIAVARGLGARGVVFGCLMVDGRVDGEASRALIDAARPLEVTFHRAFDVSRDPFESLDMLAQLGVDRLLTSGQAPSAERGRELIGELVTRAGDDIIVMPGVGIDAANAAEVAAATGAREFHVYTERLRASPMEFRRTDLPMGRPYQPDEYVLFEPDAEQLAAITASLRRPRTTARREAPGDTASP